MPDLSDALKKDKERDDLIEKIEECLDADLTHWEEDFLEDIRERVLNGKTLTERQLEKLDQIEKKVIEDGGW